ncbi:transporter [Tropicibacter sp. Alg240-R139]|uniref:SphA family protein n=1 Tax=Tropicibacter sp. Alg240-R139 TaxID=2305991 RepID=UPI0013E0E8AA|nr:transporter [Tropicibacter sp. Alg240-R139]
MLKRKTYDVSRAGGIFAALIALVGSAAEAREPGVPPSVPPGSTIGIPIAANPPPGFYLSSLNNYNNLELKDNNGDDVGVGLDVASTALHLMWVPGINLLGGDFRAHIVQPFLHVDQSSSFGPISSGTEFDLGNTQISPVGVSWAIAPGQSVAADLVFVAPTGKWTAADPVNTGANFWTFAPSLSYTYFTDDWNASVQLQYFTNTENKSNNYKSGDEILANFTALKDIGGFKIGPVGYYRKQVSSDTNSGTAFGGTISGKAEQLGLGLGLSTRVGPVGVVGRLTHDVKAKNAAAGTSFAVSFIIPMGKK